MGTGHPKNDMVNLLTMAQNRGLPGLKLKILIPSCANMVGFLPQGWVKIVPHDCPLVLVKRHPSAARDLAFDPIHVYPAIGYSWRLITHVKLLCLSMTHSCTSLLLMMRYTHITHIPWQPMICAHHNIFNFLGGQREFSLMYVYNHLLCCVCLLYSGWHLGVDLRQKLFMWGGSKLLMPRLGTCTVYIYIYLFIYIYIYVII